MKTARNEIGSFMVKTEAGERRRVIISQEVVSLYEKEQTYNGKRLSLSRIDGPPVFRTSREYVFMLMDGTELRKR